MKPRLAWLVMAPEGSSLPSALRRLPHAFPGLGFADPRTGYAEALEHGARLVGDDGDGAEVVLVEIPCRDGLVAVLDVHADHAT